jgi:hypothetical protein
MVSNEDFFGRKLRRRWKAFSVLLIKFIDNSSVLSLIKTKPVTVFIELHGRCRKVNAFMPGRIGVATLYEF